MSQNLQKITKFQKIQLDNLVDFEKCCKTHIYLQKSVPIQPKTSNILPTSGPTPARKRSSSRRSSAPASRRSTRAAHPIYYRTQLARSHFRKMHFRKMHFRKMHFSKILQIFGGLVLGCIKTKFCKKICF